MSQKNRFLSTKLVSVLLIFVLSISCSDLDVSPTNDVKSSLTTSEIQAQQLLASGTIPELVDIRAIAASRAAASFTVSTRYTFKFDGHIYFNTDRAVKEEMAWLKTSWNINFINPTALGDSIAKPRNKYYFSPRASQLPGANQVFSTRGLYYLDNFLMEMYGSTLYTGTEIYNRHKTKVASPIVSDITMDEKIMIISIFEIIHEYSKKYYSSYSRIYQDMLAAGITPAAVAGGRTAAGCSVDWRGTMTGAVVGGVFGAVFGAKAGAGGGTVVFPGLGTATGAVAGAVFGFATGFVSGAVGGIATNLLNTCFRRYTAPQPLTYVITNPQIPCPYSTCSAEFGDFKKWFK